MKKEAKAKVECNKRILQDNEKKYSVELRNLNKRLELEDHVHSQIVEYLEVRLPSLLEFKNV